MLQDIFPNTFYNEYHPEYCATEADRMIYIKDGEILVRDGDEISFPKGSDLKDIYKESTYLFSVDEEKYYLLDCSESKMEMDVPKGFHMHSIRKLRQEKRGPKDRLFVSHTAKHLSDWYRDTRYCGRCRQPMEHSEKERAMVCPKCGNTCYPRIMPAVIVGVMNEDKLLVTKYRTGYRNNALIAGFTEIGETLEETVRREVMEEAGIHVKNIRYYKSQPWGIAGDILAGFFCELDGDAEIHMDENELSFAEWTSRSELELQPEHNSLTNEMMMVFKMGRFEFRDILPEEVEQAVQIEQICFPPHEACSRESIIARIAVAPELFMVAKDKDSGKIAGFFNGIATNEQKFRDEFFTDAGLHDPDGECVMLVGLDVLPEYRRQGLAEEIVRQYCEREKKKGRKRLCLTCLEEKVSMYRKMGFEDLGIANSSWGGEEWHEMAIEIVE